jgi:hypothetical protein
MELSKITIDTSVLPRGINFVHVNDLKNAALSGVVFPPLIVERGTGRLVDGFHRYTSYKQLYGESYDADVEERDYADDNAVFVAAVEANATHGLAFSTYDRRRILVEAERRGISRDVISSAIRMPVEKADKKLADGSAFVITPVGHRQRVPLRTGLKALAGHLLTKKQEEANKRSSMKAEYHADALVKLLRAGLLSWCSKTVRTAVMALHKELVKQV